MSLVWKCVNDSLAERICLQRYGSLMVKHHLWTMTRKKWALQHFIVFYPFHAPSAPAVTHFCFSFTSLLLFCYPVCHRIFWQMLLQSSCSRIPLTSTITSINNLFPLSCSKTYLCKFSFLLKWVIRIYCKTSGHTVTSFFPCVVLFYFTLYLFCTFYLFICYFG